jgi:hypothetical protein
MRSAGCAVRATTPVKQRSGKMRQRSFVFASKAGKD